MSCKKYRTPLEAAFLSILLFCKEAISEMKTSKLLSHTLCVCEREDKYIYTHTQSATQNYYVFKKKHLFIPVTDEKKKREKTQNIREKSNRDRIGRES